MHCWVSFQGFSEVLFEFWEKSEYTRWMKKWMDEILQKGALTVNLLLSIHNYDQLYFLFKFCL